MSFSSGFFSAENLFLSLITTLTLDSSSTAQLLDLLPPPLMASPYLYPDSLSSKDNQKPKSSYLFSLFYYSVLCELDLRGYQNLRGSLPLWLSDCVALFSILQPCKFGCWPLTSVGH
ncbi:UNVERIFIED_CONTAM: hypothetical protein Sradi_1537600 [Sesamum radiatum]|uniref:Uncharacterized protein n=1 Tax=Sesamum radiatum TaxID=300843 RepID=A0AAW2U8Z8_SESRA